MRPCGPGTSFKAIQARAWRNPKRLAPPKPHGCSTRGRKPPFNKESIRHFGLEVAQHCSVTMSGHFGEGRGRRQVRFDGGAPEGPDSGPENAATSGCHRKERMADLDTTVPQSLKAALHQEAARTQQTVALSLRRCFPNILA